jgi:integrase
MLKENERVLQELVRHLQLGRPILNRNRKPIGEKTARKYKIWVAKLDEWLNKPFTQLTQEDIDSFRTSLRQDKIRPKSTKIKIFQPSVKRDIETKILKTLLNYLGKHELALFTNGYNQHKEIPALTREEVETLVRRSSLRDKVIFQILFDGGFRASEFLNVKFRDVNEESLKSEGYYKIRITESKTKPRTVGLTMPLTTEVLREWLKANPQKTGTGAPLVDITYKYLSDIVTRAASRILHKRITPHVLRHSSATHYCHILNQYQMCKRYGWAMSSDMPQIYIDREGVDDEEINKKAVNQESLNLSKEVNKLREQLALERQRTEDLRTEMAQKYTALRKMVIAESTAEIKKKLRQTPH